MKVPKSALKNQEDGSDFFTHNNPLFSQDDQWLSAVQLTRLAPLTGYSEVWYCLCQIDPRVVIN